MRTVKSVLPLLLACCLLLVGLAACRDGEEESGTESTRSTGEVTVSAAETNAPFESTTSEPEVPTEEATGGDGDEESTVKGEETTETPATEQETTAKEEGLKPGLNTETGWSHFRPVG